MQKPPAVVTHARVPPSGAGPKGESSSSLDTSAGATFSISCGTSALMLDFDSVGELVTGVVIM
jgi:hypothetical protein